ncbi:PREDICTED: uncharacterized protein LOC109164474 [Ipomoea nil]|uniref:uncharacterized protein LOC109164474 n=1 Tax=Ipomoea nil TaxID=35883 RepID=UPI0009008D2C|nr:PREDICTED: uncharacterized protein LOC109164474 [Ipomoea nil]
MNTRQALRLRVVRVYQIPERSDPSKIRSKEIVFHDEEGSFLHAHVPKEYVDKYLSNFFEGSVYAIKNFCVITNFYSYKTSPQKYMIKFNYQTMVKDLKNAKFPMKMYRLKSFREIKSNEGLDEKHFFDVIGRVIEIHCPQEKLINGKNSRLIDFTIEDTDGIQLMCTLWDEHVSKIEAFYNSTSQEPLLVLIQFCRARVCLKSIPLNLSGGRRREGEATDERMSAKVRGGGAAAPGGAVIGRRTEAEAQHNLQSDFYLTFLNFYLISISQEQTPMRSIILQSSFKECSSYSVSLSGDMEVRTISEIYRDKEFGDFWVAARIVFIDDPEWNWGDGTLRYRVKVRVVDLDGNALFLLWDKECLDLLGVSADDLNSSHTKFQNYLNAFPIMRIITDEKVVEKHAPELVGVRDRDLSSKLELELTDDDLWDLEEMTKQMKLKVLYKLLHRG